MKIMSSRSDIAGFCSLKVVGETTIDQSTDSINPTYSLILGLAITPSPILFRLSFE